ncbi:helix-turn-helix domain-containing protein [uncultured Vagococcus sp.]|uniref:helix-turn-helix domain-containing protein n=1 Tax=uncultured Vagococcus sp. TaxID=189676 RepID=UPI0028D4B109|nr:helix-turn-helix domain-containing protein [uncultured Vagococcus sp.]
MNRIKELRMKHGASLKDVAEAVAVAESQLSFYENGKRAPRDQKTWDRIADYFDVPVAYLMGISDDRIDWEKHNKNITPETVEAAARFDKLDPNSEEYKLTEDYYYATLTIEKLEQKIEHLTNNIDLSKISDETINFHIKGSNLTEKERISLGLFIAGIIELRNYK